MAQHTILTPVGVERGSATKSATSALAALLACGGALDIEAPARAELGRVLASVVADWDPIAQLGQRIAIAQHVWILGFGASEGVAQYGCMLWHEKVCRPAVANTPSEFRHAFIEAVQAGDAVIVLDAGDYSLDRLGYLRLLNRELSSLKAQVTWLAPDAWQLVDGGVGLDAATAPYRLLEMLIRVQQLTRAAAHAAGTYIDGFRVLRKVMEAPGLP
jgi:fructoselysine-6-P-deglycase FrlB-like protein